MNEPETPEFGWIVFPLGGAFMAGLLVALGAPVFPAAFTAFGGMLALILIAWWTD